MARGIGLIRQASTVVSRREFANNFMRNYYSTTIVEIISLVIAGSVLGTISGYFTESFLVTVATYLGITLWQRNRFYNWVSDQQKPGSLDASDLWSDIIKRIEIERSSVDQKAESISKNLTDLNKAISGLNLGVVVADSSWELQWLNRPAERLLGLNESNDRGSFLFSLIRSPSFKRYVESRDFSEPLVIDNFENKGLSVEFWVTKDPGNTRVVLVRDITDFRKINEMRSDFIANVSHELKTPLTVINGYLEMLIDNQLVTGVTHKAIESASSQGRRMENIIQDLLMLSQLETSKIEEQQSVDLSQIVDEVLNQARLLARSLDKTKTKITSKIEHGLELKGNPSEIFSLLSNVTSNAIRHTPDNSVIAVTGYLKNQKVIVKVEDDGPGISDLHINRLTERFYRVDPSHSSSTGGTGLGLSIASHIMIRHGGELQISSELGKGTVVECIFSRPKE